MEKHPDPLVEAIAEVIWNAKSHRLLESAGHPTAWNDQPKIIKRDEWRMARKVMAEFNRSATPSDVAQHLKDSIVHEAAHSL